MCFLRFYTVAQVVYQDRDLKDFLLLHQLFHLNLAFPNNIQRVRISRSAKKMGTQAPCPLLPVLVDEPVIQVRLQPRLRPHEHVLKFVVDGAALSVSQV